MAQVRIGEVVGTMRVVDGDSLLTAPILERIVAGGARGDDSAITARAEPPARYADRRAGSCANARGSTR